MATDTTLPPRTVNEKEAAEFLGLSVHTLRKDRQHDRRIPYFKIGATVRYDLGRIREKLAEFEEGAPKPRGARRA